MQDPVSFERALLLATAVGGAALLSPCAIRPELALSLRHRAGIYSENHSHDLGAHVEPPLIGRGNNGTAGRGCSSPGHHSSASALAMTLAGLTAPRRWCLC